MALAERQHFGRHLLRRTLGALDTFGEAGGHPQAPSVDRRSDGQQYVPVANITRAALHSGLV